MTVEMSRYEAEILIAVLTFAEGVAPMTEPAMVEAIKQLRPVRSALIGSYLRSVGEPVSVGAVDPHAASTGTPSTREKKSSSANSDLAGVVSPPPGKAR